MAQFQAHQVKGEAVTDEKTEVNDKYGGGGDAGCSVQFCWSGGGGFD
jgi:hypothetical protein